MKTFLSVAAILAWTFGAVLLFLPAKYYAHVGIHLTPTLIALSRALGAMLIGLGGIDWLARKADKPGLIAVLAGNLVVQILLLLVVIRTMQLGAGAAAAPSVIIHVTLGNLFAFFLVKTAHSDVENPIQ
jgi:hypothetical protein